MRNNTDETYDILKDAKQTNSNVGKFDLVIVPGVGLKNEQYAKTYEFMFSLTPTLEFSLWKGNYIRGQIIFPIINDGYGDYYGKVRPGFLTIEQNITLPQSTYLRLSAGHFNSFRRGFDGDLSHLFGNGDWEIGLNAGLTGYTLYDGFQYTSESLSDVSVLGHIRYLSLLGCVNHATNTRNLVTQIRLKVLTFAYVICKFKFGVFRQN